MLQQMRDKYNELIGNMYLPDINSTSININPSLLYKILL